MHNISPIRVFHASNHTQRRAYILSIQMTASFVLSVLVVAGKLCRLNSSNVCDGV